MNTFLQDLAAQRMKFLEGLDANKGDINLDIFEDFYPDRAHFVFELLQNAEDARASEAAFTVKHDGCLFDHNGTRAFTESDVRAITGIHNSTKPSISDQIGKFGIGFKSVFAYTLTPTIYSGEFAFEITRLVLPTPVEPDLHVGTRTRFWLPFNNPKTAGTAYEEVATGLAQLAETALLFLSHLQSITWQGQDAAAHEVLRVQHSANHVEVLRRQDAQTTVSSHFLRFDRPVSGLEDRQVAIAFPMALLPEVEQFKSSRRLAKQLRIVPAQPGRVSVFFPAEKETSGLRFHLHGPFVPELSRASIKDTPANLPLFDQLADLAVGSLHQIRELGLLTADFLEVLPNPEDQIPARYQGIRATIVRAMNTQSLTPTYAKRHAPAEQLLQAEASLKALLSDEDLAYLVPSEELRRWAIAAAQRNSEADRFLRGLAITQWGIDGFLDLVRGKATAKWRLVGDPPELLHGPNTAFLAWLSGKSLDWHQALYALLADHAKDHWAKQLQIVRLSSGEYSVGSACYFPGDGVTHDELLPRVDAGVYTSGARKREQRTKARQFLDGIGVREVGEAEEVDAILKSRYAFEAPIRDEDTYRTDLARFVKLCDPNPQDRFGDYYILQCADGKWRKPSGVFIDEPFLSTGLSAWYAAQGQDAARAALAQSYSDRGIDLRALAEFAKRVGAEVKIEIEECRCSAENPEYEYLVRLAPGNHRYTGTNQDWHIAGLRKALGTPDLAVSSLVWEALADRRSTDWTKATYRNNRSYAIRERPSQLAAALRDCAWVPQGDGRFVRPAEARREMLPAIFTFSEGWAWLRAIGFGKESEQDSVEQRQRQAVAKDLGFDDDATLDRALKFVALPPDEQERILAEQEGPHATELPTRESPNRARRDERLREEAASRPPRTTEMRGRSVIVDGPQTKELARVYLRDQYTNKKGEMICQVCQKQSLPFKLDSGEDYFEAVKLLDLGRHHPENYVALCPNHAAMFQHANGSRDTLHLSVLALAGDKLPIVLARESATLHFTNEHLADLRVVLSVDQVASTALAQQGAAETPDQ